ncbi:MAG TPA: ABC transporter ATP-binding protein [Bacillales bacterium]|nr:ABC transporter ATP-binding protein [Bacillales bacterium]
MLVRVLFRSFIYVWSTSKGWIVFSIFYSLATGMIPIATLWATKELINETAKFLGGLDNYRIVITLVSVQILLMLSSSLLNLFKKIFDEKVELLLGHNLKGQILKKASNVTMDLYDDPNFFNKLMRIENSTGNRFLSPIKEFFSFLENTISGVTVSIFLLSFHWLLLLVALIPLIPYFFVQLKYGKQRFNLLFNYTPLLRDADITARLITSRNSAKEVKSFGLSNHLFNRWSKKYLQNAQEHLKLSRKQYYSLFGNEGFGLIIYALIIYIILKIINGAGGLTIGDFVAIIQAVQNTQSKSQIASDNFAKILEDRLYLEDFFNFIEETSFNTKNKDKTYYKFPSPLKSSIEIKNLTFKYFNSTKKALDQISFSITPGEKIFIVGENGSGKSTLIKLLLGLYPIQQGDILFDGISIKSINDEELRKNLSVLFQDFVQYPYTIYENIGFGNIEKIDQEELIRLVSRKTGLDEIVNKYPKNYQTYLTKTLYDGEDLSGGQWQKIAFTRALFRNTQLVILDEPTAALDPKKEREVFQHFNDIAKNKTTIYISHRMSAARLADHIIVLKEGKIIEEGTFEELMIKNGDFKEMYELQSSQFKDKEKYVLF